MLDGLLLRAQGFDLEQPAYLTSTGGKTVFSLGVGTELAESLRQSNTNEKCFILDVHGSARFACGTGEKPSMEDARAEPPATRGSDVHLEASGASLRDLVKQQVHDDDKAGFKLAGLAGIDAITLDLTLDGTPELRLGTHVSGEDAVTMGWLNAPTATPPPAFSQLPADSESAIFGYAPSAADQAPFKKLALDAFSSLDALGSKDSECAGSTAAARAEFEKLFFTGGSFVGSVGLERAKAEAAAEALDKAPADKKKLAAARNAMKAWAIFGVEEPAARWADGLFALQKPSCTAKGKPKHKVTLNKTLAPRLGLPAGTVEIADLSPTSHTYVLVAPVRSAAKERTWIVVANDEATAVARLKGVLAGPSALGSRPGLASLQEAASAGGFVTAGGMEWLFAKDETDLDVVAQAHRLLRARDLPTGGRTPLVFHVSSTRDEAGKGGETSVRLSLDAAALGDIAALMF